MAFKTLTSFEVLAQAVAPGIPDVPFAQQGFFLQISNLENINTKVEIEYIATPEFMVSSGAVKLFTNIIDQTGVPEQYPIGTFLTAPIGFKQQIIPQGATWLFGVQYLLLPPPPPSLTLATGSTPQDSAEARGIVRIQASAGSKLLILATIRQVFQNFSPTGTLIDITEGAYSVPLIGGPEHSF
jgi:hypothetical protein